MGSGMACSGLQWLAVRVGDPSISSLAVNSSHEVVLDGTDSVDLIRQHFGVHHLEPHTAVLLDLHLA